MCTHGEQLWYVRHLYLAWNKSTQMAISWPSMQKKAVKKFCWCETVLAHAGWRRNSWRDVFCLSKLLSISCRRSCCVWEYTNSWFFRPLCCKWHSVSDGACYCMTGLLVVHFHARSNILLTSVEVGAHTCFAGGWYNYVSEECVWAPPITARWCFECGQWLCNRIIYRQFSKFPVHIGIQ